MALPRADALTDLAALGPQLAGWLPGQRWFQGKGRPVASVEVADSAVLGDRVLVVIADVAFTDTGRERYHVPLVARDGPAPLELADTGLDDALADPAACRLLAAATATGDVATLAGARVRGEPVTGQVPAPDATVRPLGAEQSNSSVVFDDRFVLKVLRRVEPGVHPDVEVTARLTEMGFAHVPAQHGALVHAAREPTALAILQTLVAGGVDGWELAVAETQALARGEVTFEQATSPGGLLAQIDRLGEVVAALHLSLADGFGVEDADAGHARAWAAQMRSQLDRVLELASTRAPEPTREVVAASGELRATLDALADLRDAGRLVRIHGDLHLGQVLRIPGSGGGGDDGWYLLDFEGEPLKPLAERREPSSPLRDVAGMLRSFDYAAAAPVDGATPPPDAAAWRDAARRRFLGGYVRRAGPLLPGATASQRLLHAFELDKAVYELAYEIGNRPGWLAIPAGGILRVLDAARAAPAAGSGHPALDDEEEP